MTTRHSFTSTAIFCRFIVNSIFFFEKKKSSETRKTVKRANPKRQNENINGYKHERKTFTMKRGTRM